MSPLTAGAPHGAVQVQCRIIDGYASTERKFSLGDFNPNLAKPYPKGASCRDSEVTERKTLITK